VCLDNPPDWWQKYVSVKELAPKRRLPGALIFSLALWIALIPLFSAIHMTLVPHVYCAEHRHFHEVVTAGQAAPAQDRDPATASIFGRSPASSLTTLEECPFADLAIRQGMIASRWLPPTLFDHPALQPPRVPNAHILWLLLDRAPKHSPPLRIA